MNENVIIELKLLYNVYEVSGKERHQIDAICSNFLSNDDYVDKIKQALDSLFKDDFKFGSDFCRLILSILDINKKVDYYKDIVPERVKIIVYAVLFSYLLKNQQDFLNTVTISDIRLAYTNSIDLLMTVPQTIKVDKESCVNCLGRSWSFFSWLRGDRIKI